MQRHRVQMDRAGMQHGGADQRIDQRRLARAIAAEQGQRFASTEFKTDIFDDDGRIIAGTQTRRGQ